MLGEAAGRESTAVTSRRNRRGTTRPVDRSWIRRAGLVTGTRWTDSRRRLRCRVLQAEFRPVMKEVSLVAETGRKIGLDDHDTGFEERSRSAGTGRTIARTLEREPGIDAEDAALTPRAVEEPTHECRCGAEILSSDTSRAIKPSRRIVRDQLEKIDGKLLLTVSRLAGAIHSGRNADVVRSRGRPTGGSRCDSRSRHRGVNNESPRCVDGRHRFSRGTGKSILHTPSEGRLAPAEGSADRFRSR